MSVNFQFTCQNIDVVLLDSTLMDMSNEINGILKVNDKKDVNLDKLNDKIKEKENYYITGDVLYSPQKKMTDLYNAQSYQEFSRRLSELKHQGSIFAMVFSASGILATFQTESNQDGKLEITHQDIVLKDLDPNNQLHSELVCISGQSSWTLVHKAFEASGSAAKGKPSQTTFFGKLGSCSIILSNSTFNRIYGFYQYLFIKMEARQRKLSKGMNSYSREFFSMIFESIYSEQATHYYFKVNMTIPEVYIYMPTKSNNSRDMLRFKASNIIFTRSDDAGYSAIQDRHEDNILGDPKHTNGEYSYPSIFTIASVSLSISDVYNSKINDLEVQKQDIKQNIFRTEKIKMVLESKITEARTEPNRARKRDSSTSYKILSDKTFRSKEFRVQSHLPPIEAELDSRALTVIMQIYDLWVVNIPFLVHPYLEVSQFERVSQLMSDPIFQSFDFSAHLLNKIMSHTLVSYDLKIKQIAIRFKIGRSLTLLAEDLKVYSAYGFFFTKHKNAASNLVLYDESTSATILKFDNRATNKEKRSEDYSIEVNFNNPYLLGAFKRYQNVMKEEVICWEYPIDITMNVFSRIFMIFDPTAVLYFQKESLVRYTQSKQDNLNEIRSQIQKGNRIRKLVETNFSSMPVYHNTYLEEKIFANKKDFLKAQEEQLIKMMFNFEGGAAVHLNFDGKPLYLVFTPYLSVKLHLDTNNLVHLYLKMIDPKVIDTSGYGLKDHPTIVEPHRESHKTSSIVKLVFTQLNPTLTKSKRFSSYLGIKAKNLKVIVLKRRIQELVEYGRKYLLYLFIYDRDHALRGQAYFDSIPKHSTLFLELLLQDSIYIVPRSTVSSEGLILSCNKIAVWNIGAWGASCSDLVKTGEFDPQFIVEKREFFDVLEDDQQEDLINLHEMLSGETATQRSNSSGSKSTGIHHKCQDAFRVFASKLKGMFSNRIYQSTYFTKQEIGTNSVLETGKYSTIQINFNATSMLDLKKPIIPIEVILNINELLLIMYEYHYKLLTQILFENLRETWTTCHSFDMIDYSNSEYYLRFGIAVTNGLIKYFSGQHPPERGSNDTAWKLKNESSLAAMSFDYLQYDMMAKQNGGNKTFLKTRMLQILDYRLRSKLKMQKAVIYTAEHSRRSTSSGRRHASNLFSSFGPVQTVENQSKQDDDEEDVGKIAHVDKLKKSMFSKYFAKDDFMVALEPYIYTQEELQPKEDQAKANEKNGEDAEKSERVHKKEMLVTNLKQETLSQAIAGCFNYIFTCRCARKKKDAEHRSIGVGNTDHGILESLPMVGEGIKQSADEEEKLLQMGLYQPDEPEKKMSDLLLERFTCKEVEWQITTMNQTRSRVKPDDYLLISGNFLKAEANGYDLYMEMESEWDGETILEMKIFNKTVLLLPDFLTEVLFFLKKPFAEREYHRSKDPKEKFNNYAPMLVKLDIKGMTIVWPSNLESLEQTVLQFETNLKMSFEFQGDSREGPGLYAMKIELDIAKGSEKSFSMAGTNIGSIQETRYENRSYGDLYQAGISNRDTLSVDKMPGGASKLRKQASPKKKTLLGGIAGGYMIEKVCVTYEQKYIIKNSMKVFPDEKADYITKVSMSKRGDSGANECNLYVPVTLLNKLEPLFSTISSPSAEHKNQKYDSKSSKISKHEEDLESQYNEIYELSLPQLNLMIVREYKGEELIRFEFRELNLYFRKERKNRPVEVSAVSDNFKKAKVRALSAKSSFMVTAGYFIGKIGVNYLNLRLLKYEPILETWEFEVNYLKIKE